MVFSDFLKQEHMNNNAGCDDDYPDMFVEWWTQQEPEDINELAIEWMGQEVIKLLSNI